MQHVFSSVPVTISSQGFKLTDSIRSHVVRRMLRAVSNFEGYVTKIAVRIGDINGPLRGGINKYCWVQVTTVSIGDIQIRNLGSNVYAVANRAAARVKRTLARRVARTTDIRRAG